MIKNILLTLMIFSSNLNASSQSSYNPLLVVVLMVKNEDKVICPTLEPFVKANIKSYLIFDTGSTDKTIEVTKEYFKTNNVDNYHIFQEPFVDFATSRNRALELAKEKFPNSGFLLMPDSEWYTTNVPCLINFCKDNLYDTCPAYLIKINCGSSVFYTARLLKTKSNVWFKGVVHEAVVAPMTKRVNQDVYFDYLPKAKGKEQSCQRWQRDKDLLFKEFAKDPTNPRTAFYLAQTFECLGDLQNAYKYYEIRSKLNGWDEENFETFYRLGNITQILSKIDNKFNWHIAFDHYMKAHQLRPKRAEPLIKIAEYYWPDSPTKKDSNIPACFLFARRTLDLEYPKDDTLFVDKEVYDYQRFDVLSKSAWHVGEHEIGEQATLNAIKAKLPHLYNNLMCYKDSKKKM